MPDPDSSEGPLAVAQGLQLKAPEKLNFEASNMQHEWKKWKEGNGAARKQGSLLLCNKHQNTKTHDTVNIVSNVSSWRVILKGTKKKEEWKDKETLMAHH